MKEIADKYLEAVSKEYLFFRYPKEYGILNVMLETDIPDMILYEKTAYGYTKRYQAHRRRFLLFVEALEKNL